MVVLAVVGLAVVVLAVVVGLLIYKLYIYSIEERYVKKKRQRSSLLFVGQNLFNSLPC